MLVVELAGTIKVLPPPYTTARPDAVPAAHEHRLGRRAAGHLRHRARPGLHDEPLLLRLLHARHAEPRPPRPGSPPTPRSPGRSPAARSSSTRIRRTRTPSTTAARSTSATTASSTSRPASTSTPPNAQDLTNPRGKIHRINPDGTVPTDNPFYDGAGPNCDSIWASGLRNPFRAYYDAPTGRLFVGDVGGNDYSTADEEVDLGAAGANYGWPNCEGTCAAPCTSPLYSYPAQRPRRRHHRRLRLPRHAVPGGVPGQLLLRRLHAELDPAPRPSTRTAT